MGIKMGITSSQAMKKAWTAFSKYIRIRDAVATTDDIKEAKCVTCDNIKSITGLNCMEAGHFIAGRHNSVLFNERNCHAQCQFCNRNLSGNYEKYKQFIIKAYGQETVDELIALDKIIIKYNTSQLEEIAKEYNEMYEEIYKQYAN